MAAFKPAGRIYHSRQQILTISKLSIFDTFTVFNNFQLSALNFEDCHFSSLRFQLWDLNFEVWRFKFWRFSLSHFEDQDVEVEFVIYMTSYMTCAPTDFVVIMIREINSKDEQGNANIIAIHNNHDATQQLKHLSIRRPYLATAGNRRSSSSRTGVIVQVMEMTL